MHLFTLLIPLKIVKLKFNQYYFMNLLNYNFDDVFSGVRNYNNYEQVNYLSEEIRYTDTHDSLSLFL